jgi:Bacterial Ig-like domain (group 2)
MPILTYRKALRGSSLLIAFALAGACADTTNLPDRCFVIVASVAPAAPALAVDDTVRLAATYSNVAAECLPAVPASSLVWRSSDAGVATVDSASGLVTAIAAGTAQVSAFAPGGTQVLGLAFIVVTGP